MNVTKGDGGTFNQDRGEKIIYSKRAKIRDGSKTLHTHDTQTQLPQFRIRQSKQGVIFHRRASVRKLNPRSNKNQLSVSVRDRAVHSCLPEGRVKRY